MNRILVVDDEETVRYTLSQVLSKLDYVCLPASSGAEAVRAVKSGSVNLVLLDLVMPEMDGMETLSQLKRIDPEMPVIMITGHGDIAAAVQATKLGAYDFITKPPEVYRLIQTIQRALDRFETQRSVRQLETSLVWVFGKSAAVEPVIRQIRQSAWSDAPVTIQGETGTGKFAAARIIHNLSKRAGLPYRVIKAGAASEAAFEGELFGLEKDVPAGSCGPGKGMFERAKGGTVFIDGLSHISLPVQARLAGMMEERKAYPSYDTETVDAEVRVILGSDTDVGKLASEKKLDEQLRVCLSGPAIVLPSLRERLEDVRFLAGKFLWKASVELGRQVDEVGEDALDLLMRHSWPGNITELEGVIRRSVLLSESGVLKPEIVKSVMEGETRGPVAVRPQEASNPIKENAENPGSEPGLARKAVLESEEYYRNAIRLSPIGILAHVDGRIAFANPAFARIIGAAKPEELSGRIVFDFVHADYRDRVRKRAGDVITEGEKAPLMEQRLLKLDGSAVDVEAAAFPFRYQGYDAVMVIVQDITERKLAEEAAKTRQKELEDKTVRLEEANSALKVLLSHMDQDKEELEKRILANVKKLVFPYIEKMKAGRLTDSQIAYMETIESNLAHIVSPFLQKMAAVYSHFTPTEIQVAALVKEGKTTKEIAELLKVGTGTVHTHRNGIRAKLGLSNKNVNLRSYLLSLE